jgi:hypothetical protein
VSPRRLRPRMLVGGDTTSPAGLPAGRLIEAGMELKPGYEQADVGVIPEGWEVTRLGDLLGLRNGVNVLPSWRSVI